MHMHKHSGLPLLYGKQYMPDENKKRLREQNVPEAQRQTKKNATSGRAIAPPRRVSLAINKNGFERKLFSCPPRMLEL